MVDVTAKQRVERALATKTRVPGEALELKTGDQVVFFPTSSLEGRQRLARTSHVPQPGRWTAQHSLAGQTLECPHTGLATCTCLFGFLGS